MIISREMVKMVMDVMLEEVKSDYSLYDIGSRWSLYMENKRTRRFGFLQLIIKLINIVF